MNSPLVTISLSVLNLAESVEEAINSVLVQSYPHWELIAIDDGSTDDTFEVLKRYESPNIRVFRNSVNRGLYWCRNLALMWARGDFFTTLDGDDQFHADKLKIQLEKIGDQDASLCHYIRRHPRYPGGKQIALGENTLLFRRSLVEEIGYYDTVRFNADAEYIERIALSRAIVKIPDVLVEYSVREGSLTEAVESGMAADSPGAKIRAQYKQNYQAWYKQTKQPYLSFPPIRRPFEAGGPNHALPRDPILVSVATFPGREALLRQTIDSLLPWVDRINVFLNQYKESPTWLNHPKIHIQLGETTLGEQGKCSIAETTQGYHFVCRDGTLYTEEYIQTILSKIEFYHREAIVGIDGQLLASAQNNDHSRQEEWLTTFYDGKPQDMLDFIDTEAIAYHTDKVLLAT